MLKLWPEKTSSATVLQVLNLSGKSNAKKDCKGERQGREGEASKHLGKLIESLLHFLQYTDTVQSQRGSKWHFSFQGEIFWAVLKLQLQCALLWQHQLLSLSVSHNGVAQGEAGVALIFFVLLFSFSQKKIRGKKVLTLYAVACLENRLEASRSGHQAVPQLPKKMRQ